MAGYALPNVRKYSAPRSPRTGSGSDQLPSPRSPVFRSDTLKKKLETMGATVPDSPAYGDDYEAVHSWSTGQVVMRKKSTLNADEDLAELSHNVTL